MPPQSTDKTLFVLRRERDSKRGMHLDVKLSDQEITMPGDQHTMRKMKLVQFRKSNFDIVSKGTVHTRSGDKRRLNFKNVYPEMRI